MKDESAVQFETDSRIHMGMGVQNLETIRGLLQHPVRPGADEDPAPLCKFEVASIRVWSR